VSGEHATKRLFGFSIVCLFVLFAALLLDARPGPVLQQL
jgi:heme O synthase-like polyprenyltransferase